MRIFIAGDAITGTGPANVTKYYIENLPEGTLFQKKRGRISRVPEIVINTLKADAVVYSGYSRQNILGLRLAKLLGKPSAYIMHGCVEYENGINLEIDESMNRVERKTLELCDLIIAVSSSFAGWLKEYYPMHAEKIDHITNGIDTALISKTPKREERPRHMIFTIGGGMPRKKIRYICEAVRKLREEYDPKLYVCIAGDRGADDVAIESYDFAVCKGIVKFEECRKLFDDAALFVQNSCFETFGLAPIEALSCGCPILCSRHVGALELLPDITGTDMIDDCENPDEIAAKIRYNLENSNAERLLAGLDGESDSWKKRSEALEAKLSELVMKK
ncbi:MAG: glycosyltransferase family 4 protein [Lachnospiraceae bacterium]|nr:glycosyltransferase family 4 protein [Lachnospiraceae bacterium]